MAEMVCKRPMRCGANLLRALLCALVPLILASACVHAEEKSFVGTVSNDWLTDDNWLPKGAPTAADDVTIDAGKTANLAFARTIRKLTLGGTVSGIGTLTVASTLTWLGGTMTGLGTTEAQGGLVLQGASSKTLDRTLNNSGNAAWAGDGTLLMGANAAFANQSTGVLVVQAEAVLTAMTGSPRLDNDGTIQGALRFNGVRFNNDGVVTVNNGTLYMAGSGNHSGTFSGAGTIEFASGTHNLSASTSVDALSVRFSGANVTLTGGYRADHSMVSKGTVNWRGTVDTLGELTVLDGNAAVSTNDTELVSDLFLRGGVLAGSSRLMVSGMLTWSGGVMNGPGELQAQGGVAISGAAPKTLNRILVNAGTAVWNDSGQLLLGLNGGIRNLAGAALVLPNDASILSNGGFPFVDNAGRFVKMAGVRTIIRDVVFDNRGVVEVQSGTLELGAGGTHSGAFAVSGAALELGGGTHIFDASAQVTGTRVLVSGGSVDSAATYNVQNTEVTFGTVGFHGNLLSLGALSIANGSVDISGLAQPLVLPALDLNGGELSGSTDLNLTGRFNWRGGALRGPGALNNNGSVFISGNVSKTLTRTFNNAGATEWSGAGNLVLGNGGVVNNLGGASFRAQANALVNFGGGSPRFDNAGRFVKADFGTILFNGVPFNNHGIVEVQTGRLALGGSGMHDGTFQVNEGMLDFAGGQNQIAGSISGGGIVFSGGNNVVVANYSATTTTVSGGEVHINGGVNLGALRVSGGVLDLQPEALSIASLELSGGTLTGPATVNVGGLLTWRNGAMNGSGSTNANGGLLLAGATGKTLHRHLNNAGVAQWIDTGNLSIGDGGRVHNQAGASFELRGDGSVFFNGGDPRFDNAGIFVKSVGTGVSSFAVVFTNSGTVEAQSGGLSFLRSYVQTQGVTRLRGGTIQSNGTMNFAGGSLEGNGGIFADLESTAHLQPGVSPGRINVGGNFRQRAGGRLSIEIGGTAPTLFDQLDIDAAAVLDGTLSVSLLPGFVPAAGDRFPFLRFASRSGDFASIEGLQLGVGRELKRIINDTQMILEVVEENCNDGIDNDGDGATDCADRKCFGSLPCGAAPTVTPTAVPTNGTAPTATATATVTPTARQQNGCVGDCNGDSEVTVDELLLGVNIALGTAQLQQCPTFDLDGSASVEIDELIVAVGNALANCPTSVALKSSAEACA